MTSQVDVNLRAVIDKMCVADFFIAVIFLVTHRLFRLCLLAISSTTSPDTPRYRFLFTLTTDKQHLRNGAVIHNVSLSKIHQFVLNNREENTTYLHFIILLSRCCVRGFHSDTEVYISEKKLTVKECNYSPLSENSLDFNAHEKIYAASFGQHKFMIFMPFES